MTYRSLAAFTWAFAFTLTVGLFETSAAAEPNVVSVSPAANSMAPANTQIIVAFDTALTPATVNSGTFRVFGRYSGTASGSLVLSNANQTVTFTASDTFQAGETVLVNLGEGIQAADTTPLRTEGYAFQFLIETQPAGLVFQQIDEFSNTGGPQTRIYGAMASDLNNDEFVDLMTVNEVSADVRVFLSLADGSGLFDTDWLTPQAIGVESSPNEQADFNNDGDTDAAISATNSETVSILLGAGDGSFSSVVQIPTGDQPHGIAVLDVDGDADLDVVNANRGDSDLSLFINNGSGVFGAASSFPSPVAGEYGLSSGDMNGDGITDLVAGGIDSEEVVTMLGNGDATFTASTPQDSGGPTWVTFVADVNGDNVLDVASANSFSGVVGILIGNGDGTFDPPTTISEGTHIPSVDLGDLDGDGDVDLVSSSFGGEFWRVHLNDGTGDFTFQEQIDAPNNPSCAVLYDGDNDGDLDMALTDEIADIVRIMENTDGGSLCPPTPSATCRTSPSGKSGFSLKKDGDPAKDKLQFKWGSGQTTPKSDFGDPTDIAGEDYELCIYENDTLLRDHDIPSGGICSGKTCWREKTTGFLYKDKGLTPDGIDSVKLLEGLVDGKAKIQVKGKGGAADVPVPNTILGDLDVQLHQSSGTVCWGATFSQPFDKVDDSQLKTKSD